MKLSSKVLLSSLFCFNLWANSPTITEFVYYELLRFDKSFQDGNLNKAEDILINLIEQDWRRDSYDKAVIARTFGFYLIQQERYDEGFEKLFISYETGAFPLEEQAKLVVTIAQLYAYKNKLDECVLFLENYLEKLGTRAQKIPGIADVYGLLALAYAQKEDYDLSYSYISLAVRIGGFREDWYKLKFAIEYQKELLQEAQQSAYMLVKYKPEEKRYYVQLSAIYSLLEKNKEALATLEISYLKDLLDKPDEFVRLANFYVFNNNPANSAKLLESGLDNGSLDPIEKTNLKLLSDSWLYAKDRLKAIKALEKLYSSQPTEETAKQLLDLSFYSFLWDMVIDFYKNGTKEYEFGPKYELMVAISYLEKKQYDVSIEMFKNLTEDEKYGEQAESWIAYAETVSSLLDY